MCTQALPQSRARAASSLSCIDRARAIGTKCPGGLKLLLCMPKLINSSFDLLHHLKINKIKSIKIVYVQSDYVKYCAAPNVHRDRNTSTSTSSLAHSTYAAKCKIALQLSPTALALNKSVHIILFLY